VGFRYASETLSLRVIKAYQLQDRFGAFPRHLGVGSRNLAEGAAEVSAADLANNRRASNLDQHSADNSVENLASNPRQAFGGLANTRGEKICVAVDTGRDPALPPSP
jgi:hypothetical protein